MHRAEFRIATMCRVLRVSRSGYYQWLRRGPSRWAEADRELIPHIATAHAESGGAYGIRRVRIALQEKEPVLISVYGLDNFSLLSDEFRCFGINL